MTVLDTILGVPLAEDKREQAFQTVVGDLNPADAFARILTGVQHNTEKAGALLAAQGIFAVACTFALDHGWPRWPALAAIVFVLAGAILAMSILRSTSQPFHATSAAEVPRAAFRLMVSRMIRFNFALYLTFLSLVLIAIDAFIFAL